MKKKRITLMLIIALILTIAATACSNSANNSGGSSNQSSESSKSNDDAGNTTASEQQKQPTLKVNLYYMHTYQSAPQDANFMHQWLVDNKNIDINITTFSGNATDKMNTMLASGDIPDVVSVLTNEVNNAIVNKWAEAGYIIPVDDLLKQYPDLCKYCDVAYDKANYASKKDGKLYMIPINPAANPKFMHLNIGPIIREDWLKQVGMQAPKTTDDLIKVLQAFKDKIPDVNGKPIIPATFDNFRQLMMYSWTHNWNDLSSDDKSLHWWFDNPQIEEYMVFMNKLYRAGLLDPEMLTQKPDQYQAKLSSGRVGFTLETTNPMDIANGVLKAQDPNKRFIPSPPLQVKGLPEPIYQESSPNMFTGLVISKKFASNPDNLKRLAEFLNWNASNEGVTILTTGPEGQYYDKNSDGLLAPKSDVQTELAKGDKSFEVKTGLGFYNLMMAQPYPATTVQGGTPEVQMAQKVWEPGVTQTNVPFGMSGTGDAWNKYWPQLWPEIGKWEAKAIFAKSEADARNYTQQMFDKYKKIGAPEVTKEKLDLIQKFLQANPQYAPGN